MPWAPGAFNGRANGRASSGYKQANQFLISNIYSGGIQEVWGSVLEG